MAPPARHSIDALSVEPTRNIDFDSHLVAENASNQQTEATTTRTQVGEDESKKIPAELLVRLLHSFFEKDGTRISRDANAAVAKYMDIFVKEAIARTDHETSGTFLEVSDLEKIAPQLLLDL